MPKTGVFVNEGFDPGKFAEALESPSVNAEVCEKMSTVNGDSRISSCLGPVFVVPRFGSPLVFDGISCVPMGRTNPAGSKGLQK